MSQHICGFCLKQFETSEEAELCVNSHPRKKRARCNRVQLKLRIFTFLMTHNVCKKSTIRKELNLTKFQVDVGCRELRREKIIGRYYGKYWGLR